MHGKLTVLVRYHLRYQLEDHPVIISFGLGAYVAVNSIIGLPTLRQWSGLINFGANKLVATALNAQFHALYEPTNQRLPPTVTFTEDTFIRPGRGNSIMGIALMTNMDDDTAPKTKIICPIVTDSSTGDYFKREVTISNPE